MSGCSGVPPVGITDKTFELTKLREAGLGVSAYMAESKARGLGMIVSYSNFVNGWNPDGSVCDRGDHRGRGGVMEVILDEWLTCW